MKSERVEAGNKECMGGANDEGDTLKWMKSQMQQYLSEEDPSSQQVQSSFENTEEKKQLDKLCPKYEESKGELNSRSEFTPTSSILIPKEKSVIEVANEMISNESHTRQKRDMWSFLTSPYIRRK